MSKVISNNVIRDATADEQAEIDARNTAWNNNSANRKLGWIKEIRLQKLIETDYLANSDVTMPDNIKTWRQSLRDIPQDYSADKYDELLARETDKTKANFGELTHSVWSKS
jgi:hypothetical protein